MESPNIIDLLSQAPLVGIFVIFVIYMMKVHSKERSERDSQWQTFLERQMKEERATRHILNQTLVAELKALVASTTRLADRVEENDEAAREWRARNEPVIGEILDNTRIIRNRRRRPNKQQVKKEGDNNEDSQNENL